MAREKLLPSISKVLGLDGNPRLILSAFLHSKGSATNEAGQMLTTFPGE